MGPRPNGARVPALMLQGTGSDVGKSLLAAGLGRAFTRRGLRVRPFKPQNMSNNAALADDGKGGIGEIGRAQALQARACGIAPTCDMNPVLLKPQSEIGAQVVIQGRVVGNSKAQEWRTQRMQYLPFVLESFARLAADADLMIVEGAGSPAEANLRDGDIANMGFAEAADVPVVLVGDIDRGGVLASLIGTWALLSESERARTKGYIVNKFRGDPKLFVDGPPIIAAHTGLRCFGVVPYLRAASALPPEDAATLEGGALGGRKLEGAIRIAVPRLPRIANFDDLDPLVAEPDVAVEIVPSGRPLPADADAILIPGSKSTLADLAALRAEGWDIDVLAHARRGGMVVGLCGGYQILGTRIADPIGIEGPPGAAAGLGLLEVETTMEGEKALRPAIGRDVFSGAPTSGYEMHIGRTEGRGLARPWLMLEGERPEGATSADGRVLGCYVHGLFADDRFRAAFLARLRAGRTSPAAFDAGVEAALDALAAALETHLDLDGLLAAARR